MADNYETNAGSGGATFAADDISGVLTPRVKAQWGADGTCTDTSVAAPLPVQVVGAVGAGLSAYSVGVANSINTDTIKDSAGTVFAIYAVNLHSAIQYLKFWNKASDPDPSADSADIIATFPVPASSTGAGFVLTVPQGIAFSTGIGVATTGALAAADETAVTASTLIATVLYK